MSGRQLCSARRHAVRPGFDVGYQMDKKFFVNNHLMFKILVHETYGQYTRSARNGVELEAAAAVEVRPGAAAAHSGLQGRRAPAAAFAHALSVVCAAPNQSPLARRAGGRPAATAGGRSGHRREDVHDCGV